MLEEATIHPAHHIMKFLLDLKDFKTIIHLRKVYILATIFHLQTLSDRYSSSNYKNQLFPLDHFNIQDYLNWF